MDDDLKKASFALAELMQHAMRTSYGMIAREAATSFDIAATVEAVVALLIAKGVIDADELVAVREVAATRIATERAAGWIGPDLAMVTTEEEAQPAQLVDCETRRPTCQAACCVLGKVTLTEREVRQNTLLWDLGAPYSLPRAPTGHCAYLDRDSLACTVWNDRPYVCRSYSCANDAIVWDDFKALIPAERVRRLSRTRRRQEVSDE
ncbi:MAG: YkgJ family cysteine cluster protein [Deltaproteobacteria bacterium]|nr:YkgJ family cysteine cluster protein [Deltaproteobacteria bacterium]MDQ3299286.1 YkgJ family cysteine cluster protein [Myxococcota bacterium]